jgi:hypothetical protein
MAATTAIATPTPISTSPTLKMLASGSQPGIGMMSVSGASATPSIRRLLLYARSADADPAGSQAGERLWAGHLVDEMEIDGQDGGCARILGHDVIGPDLVDDGARSGRGHRPSLPEPLTIGRERERSGPKAAPVSRCQVGGDPAQAPIRRVSAT